MTGRRALLRADASLRTGTGHVVRSGTLGTMLVARGWRVTLAANAIPAGLATELETKGVEVHRFDPLPEAREPASLADALGHGFDLVLADHYGIGGAWFEAVRAAFPGAHTAAIDDLADRPQPVELLLNQNPGIGGETYAPLVPPGSTVLLGPHYALVRPEFAELRGRARPRSGRVDRILVFMSGADEPDVTSRALAAVVQAGCAADIVVGGAYPHLDHLRSIAAPYPAIHVHVNTSAMPELTEAADLAIGAPGSAAWERCTLGLPTVLVTLADNQAIVERALVEVGAAVSLGRHETVGTDDIAAAIAVLRDDPHRVVAMGRAAASVTDGLGTARVADAIEVLVDRSGSPPNEGPVVTLRGLSPEDSGRILAWRNSPEVAASMLTDHRIAEAEHAAWFELALAARDRRYWIIEADAVPVGLIGLTDLDPVAHRASWGFYVADPSMRGRGVGSAAWREVLATAFGEIGLEEVRAEVLATNVGSLRLHERFGFTIDDVLGGHASKAGVPVDVVLLSLGRDEWRRRSADAASGRRS